MSLVNMHEAKTQLSRIVSRVERGETVVIGRAGKPVAVLSPYHQEQSARQLGAMKGKIWVSDDFDVADEEIADLFEGSSLGVEP